LRDQGTALDRGDSSTVWKLDRLGRSLRDLIDYASNAAAFIDPTPKSPLVAIPDKWRRPIEERMRVTQKLCRISAALRKTSNCRNDVVGFLVVRNGHR
jgi:hypothetical protein